MLAAAAVWLLAAIAVAGRVVAWPTALAVAAAVTGGAAWWGERARARAATERANAFESLGEAARRHAMAQAERMSQAQSTLLGVASELEQRTAQLEAANRHFELALQGSHDGVWEYDLRTKQVYLSPGFRERLGFAPDQFRGRLAWFEEHLHPDDVERWRSAVQDHLEQRTSYNMDLRLCTPSGEYRWFRARGSAEWDFTGQPVRMSGSLTDTTERRFAEARVRESEENFRSLSAASPVGILRADAFGLCEYCNQRWQEITGLSDDEALGEGWLDAIDGEDKERVLHRWTEYVCMGETFDEQFGVVSPGGERRWIHSRANAMRDEKDGTFGFVVTFEDVTDERHVAVTLADARDKAMQAAQAKSEFLANMSHEIRTPLNGVVGMTELLGGTPLSDEQRDFVRTIHTSADALLAIINDILDFSKIEAGKMGIERVEFDLRTLYEDVAELLAPRARERGLELVLAVEPSLPRRVVGDPTRIRQILLNLASNAIKFTERGEIVLGAEPVAGANPRHVLQLKVSDTGIGIPAARLGAVFDSFTQADGSTTRKYGGTGLGLTICRQLAQLMDGSIHVTSEPGQGSTFWVELPLQPGAAELNGRSEPPCDLTGARVLVVDDHPINRKILCGTLRGWGAQPEAAASGAEAVVRVEGAAGGFELVLMDYRMAGMNGMDAARRLHALPGADRRFVVMTSSASQPAEVTADVGPGRPVELWLTRPMRESSLARVLSRLLGRMSAQTQVAAASASAEEFATLSILLVDDNEVNRKVAARMLQKLGASTSVAVNGAEAVHMIGERHFDLVFMDCQMPEMDGFEATRVVRAREATQGGHVRIVAMTANAMEGDREACIAVGMDDYVSKPVKLQPLLDQLRLAIESRIDRAA